MAEVQKLPLYSYDRLDIEKEADEQQEKIADQIFEQIKSYKKLVKQHIKKEIVKHIAMQSDTNADTEDQQSKDIQLLAMVAEAQFIIDELEHE